MDSNEAAVDFIRNDEIYWRYNIKAVQAFITRENINSLISSQGISGKIGLLSIDIDGNDYWVWEKIDVIDPDIVICEYNPRFGKTDAVTIPYDASWSRFKVHHSGIYFGASIKALTLLAQKKGYSLVAGNKNATNLFFVKSELLNKTIHACSIDDVYAVNKYRDARDKNGNLIFLSKEEEQRIIKCLPLVDVDDYKVCK